MYLMPGQLASTAFSVQTMVPGHNKHRVTGHWEEGKLRKLASLVLQTGYSRGGQGVGVLGQRVQHLAVHIAAHNVANQFYLTGVICFCNV